MRRLNSETSLGEPCAVDNILSFLKLVSCGVIDRLTITGFKFAWLTTIVIIIRLLKLHTVFHRVVAGRGGFSIHVCGGGQSVD